LSDIRFGTDGWRALIAREFTFANVALLTQAIASHLRGKGSTGARVIVGYDARFLAEQFAQQAAEVLAANEFEVLLSDRDTPTPALAYNIIHQQAAGALIVTASHNPPEYQGIKFVPEYASPALPEVTDDIEARVRALQASQVRSPTPLELKARLRRFDPRPPYFERLRQIVRLDKISQAGLRVGVDPLWGTGRGYLDTLLREAGCEVLTLHDGRDPLFGGHLPDPNESNLRELSRLVSENQCELGVATDGDADRFGAVDRGGAFLHPNRLLALTFYHLAMSRFTSGSVARSAATSHMLDAVAQTRGFAVQETKVGFKWLGERLRTTDAVFVGEESAGLAMKPHIGEKDGILAGLLFVEMVAWHAKSLGELLEDVVSEVGDYCSQRLDLEVPAKRKESVMARLRQSPPPTLGGVKVVAVDEPDGVRLTLEDGSWVLVRPSGTEPLLRAYVEAREPGRFNALLGAVRELVGSDEGRG